MGACASQPVIPDKSARARSQQPVQRMTFKATNNKVKAERVSLDRGCCTSKEAVLKNLCVTQKYNDQRQGRGTVTPKIIQLSGSSSVTKKLSRWGLVSAMVDAYNTHHKLILRPDDIWQAILTQFSFYVNAHAEKLRAQFVDFEGKKTLTIFAGGTLYTVDFGGIANRMVDEQIVKNIKDPAVVDWLLPRFSTTSPTDRVSASVTIMSSFQAYFEYHCFLKCGIPEVTLEGSPDDWKTLRAKLDRLPMYDVDGSLTPWHGALVGVLDQFVKSSEGNADVAFWDKMASRQGGGSGPTYLSGWVTAFCYFGHKGNPICHSNQVDMDAIPVGVCAVPLTVDDNGVEHKTQMFAGQFSYEVVGDAGDTIRPRNDWAITEE